MRTPPGPRFEFVPAEPADADAMRALVRTAYEVYVPRIGREPAPMSADYDAVSRSGRALLAKRDSELAGLIVTEVRADALFIENLAVLSRFQGTGLGTLLLQAAEDRARESGLSELRLFTNEAMHESLSFYRRKGFIETGRGEQDGYRRVFFSRPVPAEGHRAADPG